MVQKAGLKSFASPAMSAMDLMPGNPYTPPNPNIGVSQLNDPVQEMESLAGAIADEADLNQFMLPETQQQAPGPQVKYSPSQDKIFANGLLFDVDDHQSALESKKYILEGEPMAPPPGDWVDIQPSFYAEYLNKIKDPGWGRLLTKNLFIGGQNLKYLAGSTLQALGTEDTRAFQLGKGWRDAALEKLYKNQPYQRKFMDINLFDPNDKAEGAIDWFVSVVGQQIPNLVETMLAGLAGLAASGSLLGSAGAITAKGLAKGKAKKLLKTAIEKKLRNETLTKAEREVILSTAGVMGAVVKNAPNQMKMLQKSGVLKRMDDIINAEDAFNATARANALRRNQRWGAFGGALVAGYQMGVGDIYSELLETGADPNDWDAKNAALAGAVPYAFFESVPEFFLFSKLFKPGTLALKGPDIGKQVSKSNNVYAKAINKVLNPATRSSWYGRAGQGFVRYGAGESIVESLQESGSMAISSFMNKVDLFTDENLNRLINSAAAGFAVGGAIGGAGNMFANPNDPIDLLDPTMKIKKDQDFTLQGEPYDPTKLLGAPQQQTPQLKQVHEGEIIDPDGAVVPRGVDPQIYDDVEGTATEIIPPRQIDQSTKMPDRRRGVPVGAPYDPTRPQGELFPDQDLGTPPPQGDINLRRGTGPQRLIGMDQQTRTYWNPEEFSEEYFPDQTAVERLRNRSQEQIDLDEARAKLWLKNRQKRDVIEGEATDITEDPNQAAAEAQFDDFVDESQRIKRSAGSGGGVLDVPNFKAYKKKIEDFAEQEAASLNTTVDEIKKSYPDIFNITKKQFEQKRKEALDEYVEKPAHNAMRRVWAKGGQPFSSNGSGPGRKGVQYIDKDGNEAFEPLKKGEQLKKKTKETKQDTDNIEQSTTEFNPSTVPQLDNRRDKKDLPPTATSKGHISGGRKEGDIVDPEARQKKFDTINYTEGKQFNLLPEFVLSRYAEAVKKIKLAKKFVNFLGAHHNGGIVLANMFKYAQPVSPNVVAHELGHASHSLLAEQINDNPAVLAELQAIENFLYPNLRATIEQAIADGKKLDNEFFNYLLSPEELIAEFNVFRLADPQQAAQIAPVLNELLESVEQAPNLVIDRKTFPIGIGRIVTKATEFFDGDFTKLNFFMRDSKERADRKTKGENLKKGEGNADSKRGPEEVPVGEQTGGRQRTRTEDAKETDTTKKTKTKSKEEILRKGTARTWLEAAAAGKLIPGGIASLREKGVKVTKIADIELGGNLPASVVTYFSNKLKGSGRSIIDLPAIKTSERTVDVIEITETEGGLTVYKQHMFNISKEEKKNISETREALNEDSQKRNKTRDKSMSPTNHNGLKSAQAIYNAVKPKGKDKKSHWLEWDKLREDDRKNFILKSDLNQLDSTEVNRLYYQLLRQWFFVIDHSEGGKSAAEIYDHIQQDLDAMLPDSKNMDTNEVEKNSQFDIAITEMINVAFFKEGSIAGKTFHTSKDKAGNKLEIQAKALSWFVNARETGKLSDPQLRWVNNKIVDAKRQRSSFNFVGEGPNAGKIILKVKLENGNVPSWLIWLDYYKQLPVINKKPNHGINDLVPGTNIYIFEGLEGAKIDGVELSKDQIDNYNIKLNEKANYFTTRQPDLAGLEKKRQAEALRLRKAFEKNLSPEELKILNDISMSYTNWRMDFLTQTRDRIFKNNSLDQIRVDVSKILEEQIEKIINGEINIVAASFDDNGKSYRKNKLYTKLVEYMPNRNQSQINQIKEGIERLFKHADQNYKVQGIPLWEYFDDTGKLTMKWHVKLEQIPHSTQHRISVRSIPSPVNSVYKAKKNPNGETIYELTYDPDNTYKGLNTKDTLEQVNKMLTTYYAYNWLSAELAERKIKKDAILQSSADALAHVGYENDQADGIISAVDEKLKDINDLKNIKQTNEQPFLKSSEDLSDIQHTIDLSNLDLDDSTKYRRLEDDKPITPMGIGKVKLLIKQLLRKLKVKPRVFVYKNLRDLILNNPELHAEAKAARIEGDFDTVASRAYALAFGTKVIVFSDNIATSQQLKFTLAHEILGHFGLRSIFSKGELRSTLENIYDNSEFVKNETDRFMKDHDGVSRLEAIEEVIADYAAVLESTIWKRFWAKVRTALHNIFGIKFKDDLARTLINQINRYVRHGQIASDVSMLSMQENAARLEREAETRFAASYAAQNGADHLANISASMQPNGRDFGAVGLLKKAWAKAGGIKNIWDFIKRELSTLDNMALYSRGIQEMFIVAQRQGNYSTMLLNKYEQMTDFVRNMFNGPNKEERHIANMLLAYATMAKLYDYDTSVKQIFTEDMTPEQRYKALKFYLVDEQTGLIIPNQDLINKIKEIGNISIKDIVDNFKVPIGARENPGYTDLHKQMNQGPYKIDLKTFDPVNNASHKKIWTLFTEHRDAIAESNIDVVHANYHAFEEEKANIIRRWNVFNDNADKKIMKRIIDVYNTLRLKNSISKDGDSIDVSQKAFDRSDAFLVAITRALWQDGAAKDWQDLADGKYNVTEEEKAKIIEKFGAFTDLSQFKGLTSEIRDIIEALPRLHKLNAGKSKVQNEVQNSIRELGMEFQILKESEMTAMHTIFGNYVHLPRKGRYQVRPIAYAAGTTNIVKLSRDSLALLPFFQPNDETTALNLQKALDEEFALEGGWALKDEAGNEVLVDIKFAKEDARGLAPLEGTIDFVAFIRTLKNMGVELKAHERHKVAVNLSGTQSRTRKALRRSNVIGFDEDIMNEVKEYLEMKSRIAAKNKYRYRMTDIMLDGKLWNGDPDLLDSLASQVNAAHNATDKLIKLREYQRYVQQFVTMASKYNGKDTYTDLNGKVHKLLGRGNTYQNKGIEFNAFFAGQTDIVHSTEDMISQNAGWLKTMTVMFQLGGNIASAAINLFSLTSHATPYLAYMTENGFGGGYGLGNASFEITKASKQLAFARWGNAKYLEDVLKEFSKGESAAESKYGFTADEIHFLLEQTKNGTLQAAQFNSLQGSSKGGLGRDTIVPGAIKIAGVKAWMSMFSYTEQLNRRVTALAAYRLEKKRILSSAKNNSDRQRMERELSTYTDKSLSENFLKQTLYAEAQMAVNKSQGEYGMYNRPSIARGGWMQYAFLYKQFLMISVNLMKRMDYRGKIMFLGLLLLFAGVKGLPFADDLMDAIDTLMRIFGIKKASVEGELIKLLEDLPKEFLGYNVPHLIMRGAIDQWFGGTVSTRLGFGDLIPFTGLGRAGLGDGHWWREIKNGLGPVFSASWDGTATAFAIGGYGMEKIGMRDDTTSFKNIIKNSPVAGLRNMVESYSYAKDGVITNRQGKVISRDLAIGQWFTRLLGFYPTIATRHNDLVRVSKYANARILSYKNRYTQAYVTAMVLGDKREARRVLGMVRDWNRVHKGTEWEFRNFLKTAGRSLKEAKNPTLARYYKTTPLTTRGYLEKMATIMGVELD